MPVELCHHVKEDGISCHSPALRGLGYCHFHLRYKGHRLRTWRNRHRICGWHFTKRSVSSLYAIAANLKRVEMALAGGCSDPGTCPTHRLDAASNGLRCALDGGHQSCADGPAAQAWQPSSSNRRSRKAL